MISRRLTWRLTPVVLIVSALILTACSAPTPTPAPMTPTPAPTTPAPAPTTQAPIPSAHTTPTPAAELTHFASSDYAFDYPADWRVVARDLFTGADFTLVVVGTGDWQDGCETLPAGGIHCGDDVFLVDPGEVVAQLSTRLMGPAELAYEAPPFHATLLASGLAATIDDGARRTLATVFIPGHRPWTVDVRFGSEPAAEERATVHRLIASLDVTLEARPVELRTADDVDQPERCARLVVRGQMTRGDVGGINLSAPTGAWPTWPSGWSARIGHGGRAEVLDEHGALVAREWDEIEIGGRGDPNDLRVCTGDVTVVERFPALPH